MVAIPLGVGAYQRSLSNQPPVILKNMVVEKEISGASEDQYSRIQRPGCLGYQSSFTVATQVRGLHYTQGLFGSQPLKVVNDKLYKFTTAGDTLLGTVGNDDLPVQFASTNFGVAVLSNSVLFFHDGTTLTTVSIPGAKIPVSITSINSYVIIGCSDGTWFWLEPGDTVIDPLHFATAESMPDDLIAVKTLRSEVYFFSSQSMEVWQPTTDPNIILTRANGREWDKGIMGRDTLQPIENSMIFVGSDGIVYSADSLPQRISNVGIEERLRSRTGIPSAFTYTYDGHAIYALYIPGQGTWAYDVMTGEWAEYTTSGDANGWLPRVACAVGSTVLVGARNSGKVMLLTNAVNSDDGTVFERAVSGAVAFHGPRQRNFNISAHCGASVDAVVRLRYHDGGTTSWSSYRNQTVTAPTKTLYWWSFPAAKQPSRVVEFSCVADATFSVHSAQANEGRAN